MNKTATRLAQRAQVALKSGKLKRDATYTVPALAIILGTTRAEMSEAVNREFGSIAEFYRHVCVA